MSLKHAVLTSLLDGEASGYDLAKRMDISVARWWHALPTQIYAELRRLEEDGLVEGREVPQERRPNKRVYAISDDGRTEVDRFTREPARPTAIKDDLLIKIQSADAGDLESVAESIDRRREEAEVRLEELERLLFEVFLKGRSEEEYLETAHRIGPYLNLRRGRDFERENVEWYRWAAEALRKRAREGRRTPARRQATEPGRKPVPVRR
jgi:DNA-binding PadR family transcriptional regulator